jgi:hypothetical protein
MRAWGVIEERGKWRRKRTRASRLETIIVTLKNGKSNWYYGISNEMVKYAMLWTKITNV